MCICVTASCTGNRSDCRERHHCSLPCIIFVNSSTHFSPHKNTFSTRKYVLLSMHTLSTRLDVFCNQSEIFPCGKIFTPQKHVSGVCNKYGLLGCSHVRSHGQKTCSVVHPPPCDKYDVCDHPPPSSRHGRPALCQGDTGAGNLGTCLVSSLNSNSHSQDLIDCHAHHWLEKIPNYFGHIWVFHILNGGITLNCQTGKQLEFYTRA